MSKRKLTSTDVNKELVNISKENKEARKILENNTKKAVDLLKNLIRSTPEITAVRWSQYTPSFNDGDPCEFSVNDIELKFNPELLPVNEEIKHNDRGEEEDIADFVSAGELDSFFERQEDVLNFKDVADVEKSAELFVKIHFELSNMGDTLEKVFGNNVQITVTRKGIEKEEWDCGY